MEILDVINELLLFSPEILTLGKPVNEKLLKQFEETYNLQLPNDYKFLLRLYNGIDLYGTSVYGIDYKEKLYLLPQCYEFEHFEVGNPMPLYLVPFSPDGRGNHYCFDTRIDKGGFYPIIFWQHDFKYSDVEFPEITHENLADFIKEVMIDWLLEDYDYDGTEK